MSPSLIWTLSLSELLVHLYADHLGILYQQLLDQFTYVEWQINILRVTIYINLCHNLVGLKMNTFTMTKSVQAECRELALCRGAA